MENVKGCIEGIKQNANNYAVKVGDNWYSMFGQCPFNDLDSVSIDWDFDKTRRFRNIKVIKAISDDEVVNLVPVGKGKPVQGQNKGVQDVVDRQHDVRMGLCLKVAISAYNSFLERIDSKEIVAPEQLVSFANRLKDCVWPKP